MFDTIFMIFLTWILVFLALISSGLNNGTPINQIFCKQFFKNNLSKLNVIVGMIQITQMWVYNNHLPALFTISIISGVVISFIILFTLKVNLRDKDRYPLIHKLSRANMLLLIIFNGFFVGIYYYFRWRKHPVRMNETEEEYQERAQIVQRNRNLDDVLPRQ